MISLRHTALGLALSLAFAGQALAVTTIPFWHSMEGELGKEVDSLAQRFNAANPDYKIVPVYKGLSLIHISEPTRLGMISYAVFCLKKKTSP